MKPVEWLHLRLTHTPTHKHPHHIHNIHTHPTHIQAATEVTLRAPRCHGARLTLRLGMPQRNTNKTQAIKKQKQIWSWRVTTALPRYVHRKPMAMPQSLDLTATVNIIIIIIMSNLHSYLQSMRTSCGSTPLCCSDITHKDIIMLYIVNLWAIRSHGATMETSQARIKW